MANLKSSKKDIRRTKKRTQANASLKSKVVAMTSAKHNVFSKKSISRHISSLVKTLKGRFSQTEQVVA